MKTAKKTVNIVGAGLAGCEAAWQCLNRGLKVRLYEMRPEKSTEAHKTGDFAELVCSNSFKSFQPTSAPGQLKVEMAMLDSLIVEAAYAAKVPAGNALAVDRGVFSAYIEKRLSTHENFERVHTEVTEVLDEQTLVQSDEVWIFATGPLTSEALAASIDKATGQESRLFFYDAIAPTIDADTIDFSKVYTKDRYAESGTGDYLNVALNKEQYESFVEEVSKAQKVPLHSFEKVNYFESCLPIEVMIERGVETLRFGPLKPVGLEKPSGERPWAVIQLRAENVDKTMYSMVGFQTKMTWTEQKRIFRLLPGLESAEFHRLGSIHRNTYVNGPSVLQPNLSLKYNRRVFLAGQITGVEGYTESSAMGVLAGRFACAELLGEEFEAPPKGCMVGALLDYVTVASPNGKFAPMNINLGLLPGMKREKGMSKADKKIAQVEKARGVFESYLN